MSESILTQAIIGHLVGDYLLQNDWMAMNKKSWNGSLPCAVHCLLWTLSVMLFAGWVAMTQRAMVIFFVLFWTHYLQDRTQIVGWWMRLKWKDQTQFSKAPTAPWSLIVVDNVWHIVVIWGVWRLV